MGEPVIFIATVDAAARLDRVLGARGRGYGTFTVAGLALAGRDDPKTITHYLALDMSADSDLALEARAMADPERRRLPDLTKVPAKQRKQWGVKGEITIEEAQAALDGLTVVTYVGPDLKPRQWMDGVLDTLGLVQWAGEE